MKSLKLMMVALLVGAVAGCAGNGTKPGGTYNSPLDNFSIVVPQGFGMRMQEFNDENSGRVSFHDDFGALTAVTYDRLPPGHEAALAERRDEIYNDFLHLFAVPELFSQAAMSPSVVHEEYLGTGEGRRFLAFVSLPGGSTLANAATQERLDSMRAVYVFYRSGFMYMVESERHSGFDSLRPGARDPGVLTDEDIELAKFTLNRIVGTMRFE